MRLMIYLSLILNLCVLIAVCGGLLMDASWANRVYGGPSAARQILLSVDLAIAFVSVVLVIRPEPRMVATLLLLQVVYKMATPFIVADWQNPVVLSNICISAVHTVTLALIWRATNLTPRHPGA